MDILQKILEFKPGMGRNVTIVQHKHVYETGGKLRLKRRPTFMDVLKLLTKRDVAKVKLSTSYISYRRSITKFNDLLFMIRML